MADVKNLFKVIHLIALLFWGLNIVEIVKKSLVNDIISNSIGGFFEDVIKLLMALAGLVYFIIKIKHTYKSNRLDRIIKQQQIDKTALENMVIVRNQARKKREKSEKKEN